MIKKLWIAIVAIGIAGTVNAQDVNSKKVKFGIKLGTNISSINGKDANNLDSKSDAFIGGVIEIQLNEKFSLQPELIYSPQGAKNEGEYTLDINYLSMPIMAKYYLVKGFSFELGPQFSFLLKDEISTGTAIPITENTDAENFDFSMNLGMEYKLENGMFFSTRYSLGFVKIFDWDPPVRNGVFQMSLGYQF